MVYYITSFSHSWPSIYLCQTANALLSMFVRPALKFCSFPALLHSWTLLELLYWSYWFQSISICVGHSPTRSTESKCSTLVLYESSHLEAVGSELTCVSVCAGSWCCGVTLLLGSELFVELTVLCFQPRESNLWREICGLPSPRLIPKTQCEYLVSNMTKRTYRQSVIWLHFMLKFWALVFKLCQTIFDSKFEFIFH